MAKSSLGIITLPIIVGPVTLPTPIHVMLGNLTYNLLLGSPWIHSMQVVPSTLHRQVKFIYNNKTYTLLADTKSQELLRTGSSCSTTSNPSTSSNASTSFKDFVPSSTLDPSTQSESPPKDIFSPERFS